MNELLQTSFFQHTFYGISLATWFWIIVLWCLFGFIFLAGLALLKKGFTKHRKITGLVLDEVIILVVTKTHRYFFIPLALLVALALKEAPDKVMLPVKMLVSGLLFLQIGQWLTALIRLGSERAAEYEISGERIPETTINAVGFVAKLLLWAIILLLALDNFGVNITALVAGLGIGGIAVALAVQNILGDLFAYLSIAIDHPFAVGDFLILDPQTLGVVEKVGLKTTRIRSLSGEQIVVANSDLLNSRIRNYKRMNERRVLFNLGVIYQTPKEKLARIPIILKEIVSAQEKVRFDRAHFQKYGNFSLDFEIVYFVLDPDYNVHMDIQQTINFAIFDRFAQEGIEFAYPTQTLFIEKSA